MSSSGHVGWERKGEREREREREREGEEEGEGKKEVSICVKTVYH